MLLTPYHIYFIGLNPLERNQFSSVTIINLPQGYPHVQKNLPASYCGLNSDLNNNYCSYVLNNLVGNNY